MQRSEILKKGKFSEKIKMGMLGAVTGIANGFFGSGGGIIAVPMLKKQGYEPKHAHACSLAITLPLSAVSALFYGLGSMGGDFDIKGTLPLILIGLLGALLGTALMKKIQTKHLSRLFGAILIAAGIRGFMA